MAEAYLSFDSRLVPTSPQWPGRERDAIGLRLAIGLDRISW
jgi:hypothetical protein